MHEQPRLNSGIPSIGDESPTLIHDEWIAAAAGRQHGNAGERPIPAIAVPHIRCCAICSTSLPSRITC